MMVLTHVPLVDPQQALDDMDHGPCAHLWPEVEFETVDGKKLQVRP